MTECAGDRGDTGDTVSGGQSLPTRDADGPGGTGGRTASTAARGRRGIDPEGIVGVVFGDRRGLALFLAALVLLPLGARVGTFIVDTVAIANTLWNVAAGSLAVTESPFSLSFGIQPGLYVDDGVYYGRNYGQVFLATPILLGLRGAATLFEPRVVLLGTWALCGLALGRVLASQWGRPTVRHVVSVGVGGVVVVGLLEATALPESQLPIVALQFVTVAATGVATVAVYRLVSLFHGPRVGSAAGIGLLLASPLSFWATIPKRHALSAAAIAVAVFLFATSRTDGPRATAARAGTYAVLGLFATVHAFEAALLVTVLVPVDLATAPSNDARTLAGVAGGFLLSLVPLFVVNVLVAGNPLKPPRMLEAVDPDAGPPGFDRGPGGGGGPSGDAAGDAGTGLLETLLDLGSDALRVPAFLLDSGLRGLAVLGEPERLWHVFVRSGYVPGVEYAKNAYETVELAVLESFPLLATLAWLPLGAVTRLRTAGTSGGTAGKTDFLVATWSVAFVLVYLPRLPLHAMITARYILPLAPLGIYIAARLPPVRAAVTGATRPLAVGFVASTGAVTVCLLAAIVGLDLAVGEAVQLHALIGLGTGTGLVIAVLSRPLHGSDRSVAAALAAGAGVTASFLLLSAFVYFGYGEYAFDPARLLASWLPTL